MNSEKTGITVSLPELVQLQYDAARIQLAACRKVHSQLSGDTQAAFIGRGMDFEEVRQYQAGDDVRTIDWRVTARTHEVHTKIYREERERPVYIVLDFNQSMYFGSRVAFKSVQAAKSAALIAWASVKQGDRIGAIINSGNKRYELPIKGRTKGVMRLLSQLVKLSEITPKENFLEGLQNSLMRLRRIIRPGSLIFILSDFYQLNDEIKGHLNLLSKHNKLIAGYFYDPLEEIAPTPGQYSVSDGEQNRQIDTRSKKYRQQYSAYFKQKKENLIALMRAQNIPLVQCLTTDNPVDVWQQALRRY